MKNVKNVMLLAFCLSLTMPTVYADWWSSATKTVDNTVDDTASGATQAADDTASGATQAADDTANAPEEAADAM